MSHRDPPFSFVILARPPDDDDDEVRTYEYVESITPRHLQQGENRHA